jgi:hypothetical protein
MRDIRTDLRERLDAIATQRLQLDQMESSVRALLVQEEARFAGQSTENLKLLPAGSLSLSALIATIMASEKRRMKKEEIRDAAIQAYDFGRRAPGRVLNFTLQGMKKAGIVDEVDGGWELKGISVQ